MEPFSGREMWRPANVNALEELMHRTLICSSSARWRHVWKKGRVCAWIPNTLQVPRKLRACFLLHRGKSHQSGKKLSVLIQLSGEDVGENHQRTSCCAGALTRHLKRSSPQLRGRVNMSIVQMGKLRIKEQKYKCYIAQQNLN